MRLVTSYNQDTLNEIKRKHFNPFINMQSTPLLEYFDKLKSMIFGPVYYHLSHRPLNIAEVEVPIKNTLDDSINLLEEMGEEIGVVFLIVGLPQQYGSSGALRNNEIHIYEGINKIIPTDDQYYFTNAFLSALYTSDQMKKTPEIKRLIGTRPRFYEGMVEETNQYVELKSRGMKHVRFFDLGKHIKTWDGRLVVKISDNDQVLFSFHKMLNQNESNPLHLYKRAYDLTSIVLVEETLAMLREQLKIDTSGFINIKNRTELLERHKKTFGI